MLIPTDRNQSLFPPFRYKWQLWLFLGFIGIFLLLPVLPKPEWMDRSKLYLAYVDYTQEGRNTYFANEILQKKEDIDILFIGASYIGKGINPLIVKEALRPILGREPIIYVVGHEWDSMDYDYILLRDVLSRRKVRLVLWQRNQNSEHSGPYQSSRYLWDLNLHHFPVMQLPQDQITSIYFFNVMNGLRLVLSPFKDRLPAVPRLNDVNIWKCDLKKYFGACIMDFNHPPIPPPPVIPENRLIHTRQGGDQSLIAQGKYTAFEQIFSDAFFHLAKEHGAEIAFIQVPKNHYIDNHFDQVLVPAMAPNQLGAETSILAAAPRDLFPGQTPPKIIATYYSDTHLHHAGADYLTRSMLPGIILLFQQTTTKQPLQP